MEKTSNNGQLGSPCKPMQVERGWMRERAKRGRRKGAAYGRTTLERSTSQECNFCQPLIFTSKHLSTYVPLVLFRSLSRFRKARNAIGAGGVLVSRYGS